MRLFVWSEEGFRADFLKIGVYQPEVLINFFFISFNVADVFLFLCGFDGILFEIVVDLVEFITAEVVHHSLGLAVTVIIEYVRKFRLF